MSPAEFYRERAESNQRLAKTPLDRHFWATDAAYWRNRETGQPILKVLDAMSVANWYAVRYDH